MHPFRILHLAITVSVSLLIFTIAVRSEESKFSSAQKWFEQGLLMMEARNSHASEAMDRAIRDLDDYLGGKTGSRAKQADAYTLRSKCRSMLGNYRQAVQDLDRAIELSSDDGERYYLRALLHETLKETDLYHADLRAAASKGYQRAKDDMLLKGVH